MSLQRGTPTLVSVVAEPKQGMEKKRRGEQSFLFSFLLLYNFYNFLVHDFPVLFFSLFFFLFFFEKDEIFKGKELERESRQVAIVTWLIGAVAGLAVFIS